jgi:hypothetical protein
MTSPAITEKSAAWGTSRARASPPSDVGVEVDEGFPVCGLASNVPSFVAATKTTRSIVGRSPADRQQQLSQSFV